MESSGPGTVVLTVDAADWTAAIDNLEKRCASIVSASLELGAKTAWLRQGEVSVLLGNDQQIRDLNATYRQKDRPTNVLSFPNFDLEQGNATSQPPPGPVLLGDIAMSFERLKAEAPERGKPLLDHFAHLLVHGTLHLLGYDHEDESAASVMEGMEATVLSSLGMARPYDEDEAGVVLGALP